MLKGNLLTDIIGASGEGKMTPLHFACLGGSKQTVQFLVEAEDLKFDIGEFY